MSLSEFNPKAVKEFTEVFQKYAVHIAEIEKGNSPLVVKNKFDSELKYNLSGIPEFPPFTKNQQGNETAAIQKGMIRTYINSHYS